MIMLMASRFSLITLFVLFSLVSSEIILEEGYTVTTVFDGNKLKINPRSVLARPGSSDLLLLDFTNSHLYSVSFPLSNESEVKRISSEGKLDYRDGELGRARFNNPKSFASDAKGNVYVADKGNHVIRKITTAGTVTTIAGGISKEIGKQDGPAQKASFSNDFELAVIAERCILLVVDHGTQLIRQIDLKPEDCATTAPSGQNFGLQAVIALTLGLGLSCLLGIFVGILVRPYVIPHTGRLHSRRIQQDMEAFPNQFGETSNDALLRVNSIESRPSQDVSVSLLDSDVDFEVKESRVFADQSKDMICFEGNPELPNTSDEIIFEQGDGSQNDSNVLPNCHGKIDTLIQANVMGFANAVAEPVGSSLGLVKRR